MSEDVKKVTREDKIRIADEVIATIAGVAASEVKGVTSMSGNITDGIAGMLGKKNLGKGVKVEAGEKEVIIDLSVVVEYGCRIHYVAKEIQNNVRAAVEEMTGMEVVEINVNILGVNTGKNLKKDMEDDSIMVEGAAEKLS